MLDMSVQIGPMRLKNPILLASGTVGYGEEISEFIDLSLIGGIVTKSVSLKPRHGNPPGRICETPSGMLNAIGLQNLGVEAFINEKIPVLKKMGAEIICNIAGSSLEEYSECLEILDAERGITGFEINISCPNVKEGGLEFGHNIESTRKITSTLRRLTNKALIIKLSPNTARISDFALACKQSGADAVSAINTLVGCSIDIHSLRPKLANVTGGLSGPAIRPVAIAKVLEISRKVGIPIIGIGGIMNYQDAAEFMIAGASAVEIGTANFINPNASVEVLAGLKEFAEEKGLHKISELTASYRI